MKARQKGASFCWKFWQVSLYLTAFACAVVAAVSLGVAVDKFDGRCPLYTDGSQHFTVSNGSNPTVSGVDDASVWESKSTCDFSTYVPVTGATFGFVLAYFVVMFDTAHYVEGGAVARGEFERLQRNRMPGMFLPLLCSSILLTIIMLISSVRALNGTNVFCDGIQNALHLSCQEAQNLPWEGFPFVDNFYTLLLTSVITSWISSSAFILSTILLLLRCCFSVDHQPATTENSKTVVRRKAKKSGKLSRTESQRSLLPATETETTPPLEPLPGTSLDEPQFTGSPGSAQLLPLTVIS